jgi:hypothetical protein
MDFSKILELRRELTASIATRKGIMQLRQKAFDEEPEIVALKAELQKLTEQLSTVEDLIRSDAVIVYNKDPEKNKNIFEDVIKIKVMTVFEYEPEKAFDWAKKTGLCLSLDTKAFKDLCKSDSNRPSFVKKDEEPQATLAAVKLD